MPAKFHKPIFVLVPGASLTPAHYGILQHFLMLAGYGVVSAMLPSNGNGAKVTIEDDADFVRNRMILPILDLQEHDVITISHSYSSLPTSTAATDLSKEERTKEGKKTSVLGQIFIAAIMTSGGDGKSLISTFGGQLPPHLYIDEIKNLVCCDDPKPLLFHDVESTLADCGVASSFGQSLTCSTSPIPRASWDACGYKGRCAFIRTTRDRVLPYEAQTKMLQATGQEWITEDIESGHMASLSQPEKLANIIVKLAQHFEAL